jgi:hypothetical protein
MKKVCFIVFFVAFICVSTFRHYPTNQFSATKFSKQYLSPQDLSAFFPAENDNFELVSYIQNGAILFGVAAFIANEQKPKGNARIDLIEIRKSLKISENLGVFAKSFIPKGTSIGRYPGYILSVSESLSRSIKIDRF